MNVESNSIREMYKPDDSGNRHRDYSRIEFDQRIHKYEQMLELHSRL